MLQQQFKQPQDYIQVFKFLRAHVRPELSIQELREIQEKVGSYLDQARLPQPEFVKYLSAHRAKCENAVKVGMGVPINDTATRTLFCMRLRKALDDLILEAESYAARQNAASPLARQGPPPVQQGPTRPTGGVATAPVGNTAVVSRESVTAKAASGGATGVAADAESALKRELAAQSNQITQLNVDLIHARTEIDKQTRQNANLTTSYNLLSQKQQSVQQNLESRLRTEYEGKLKVAQEALQRLQEERKVLQQQLEIRTEQAKAQFRPKAYPQYLEALRRLAAAGLPGYRATLVAFVGGLLEVAVHVEQEDTVWLISALDRLERFLYQSPESANLPGGPEEAGVEILHLILSTQHLMHRRLEVFGIRPIHPGSGDAFKAEIHACSASDTILINDRPEQNDKIHSLLRIGFYDSQKSTVLRRAQVRRYLYIPDHAAADDRALEASHPERTDNKGASDSQPAAALHAEEQGKDDAVQPPAEQTRPENREALAATSADAPAATHPTPTAGGNSTTRDEDALLKEALGLEDDE